MEVSRSWEARVRCLDLKLAAWGEVSVVRWTVSEPGMPLVMDPDVDIIPQIPTLNVSSSADGLCS